MATNANSTRTPLLSPLGAAPPLLPRGASWQPGPVTLALRAMQSGIPETERERVRALRRRIADRIEADIALLDMLSGDPDLEEENEHGSDDDQGEETLGWPANVGQLALGPNTADGDATALESFGVGFRRSGHEDDEDTCDREGMTDDNGIADAAGAWDAGFADFGAHVWPSTGDMLGERHS